MAWDITALGMPSANLPFETGLIDQHFELKGHWLDKGRIRADDLSLLSSPIGLNKKKCLGTLVFASATQLTQEQRDQLLSIAREVTSACELGMHAGATSPNEHVVVVRMLSDLVEPTMFDIRKIWLAWRSKFWGLEPVMPRIWAL
jgi:urease accessory protein